METEISHGVHKCLQLFPNLNQKHLLRTPPKPEPFYYYMPVYICIVRPLRFVCSVYKEFNSKIL